MSKAKVEAAAAASPVAPAAPEVPAVPAAEKPAKEPKAPKVEREKQNGQTKPAEGTLTRKLWDVIDAISAKNGAPAARKEVMEAAVAGGFNPAMSASLYSHWRKFHGLIGASAPGRPPKAEAPEAPAVPETAPDVVPDVPEAPAE